MALSPGRTGGDGRGRLLWMAGFAGFAFLVLLSRLYHLQVLRGEEYKGRADENFVKELRVPADRGLILDRNRKVLVDSRPSYDVVLIPYFCGKGCDDVVTRLATLLSLSFEEEQRVREHLRTARGLVRFRPFTVKVDISRDELDVVRGEPHRALRRVDVLPTPHRSYRHGIWASHLLGYMNEVGAEELEKLNAELERQGGEQQPYQPRDFVGRRGLEQRCEPELRGRRRDAARGRRRPGQRQAGRASSSPRRSASSPRRPGNNLVLSHRLAAAGVRREDLPGHGRARDRHRRAAPASCSRWWTGPPSTPTSWPAASPAPSWRPSAPTRCSPSSSAPSSSTTTPARPSRWSPRSPPSRRARSGPGGTVYCPGRYTLGGHSWRCDKESGHGHVDLEHALGASCDVFFYALGDRMGTDRIAKWGSLLGLGKPTGLDLRARSPASCPTRPGTTPGMPGGHQHGMSLNIAIGQGDVNVTPLQQAGALRARSPPARSGSRRWSCASRTRRARC